MRRSLGTLVDLVGDGFDIVHVHTPIASFLTRLAAARTPRDRRPAVVYTAHGFHFHKDGRAVTNLVFAGAEKLAGRWTDRLVVINHEDRAQAARLGIVPREHLVEMPGIGVDTSWFSPGQVVPETASAIRAGLSIPDGSPTFVLVGELNRNKRPTDVIEALSRMNDERAHLIMLGDGPSRDVVIESIRAAGLERRVHLQGVVDDVRPYIAAADALVARKQAGGTAPFHHGGAVDGGAGHLLLGARQHAARDARRGLDRADRRHPGDGRCDGRRGARPRRGRGRRPAGSRPDGRRIRRGRRDGTARSAVCRDPGGPARPVGPPLGRVGPTAPGALQAAEDREDVE